MKLPKTQYIKGHDQDINKNANKLVISFGVDEVVFIEENNNKSALYVFCGKISSRQAEKIGNAFLEYSERGI